MKEKCEKEREVKNWYMVIQELNVIFQLVRENGLVDTLKKKMKFGLGR